MVAIQTSEYWGGGGGCSPSQPPPPPPPPSSYAPALQRTGPESVLITVYNMYYNPLLHAHALMINEAICTVRIILLFQEVQ